MYHPDLIATTDNTVVPCIGTVTITVPVRFLIIPPIPEPLSVYTKEAPEVAVSMYTETLESPLFVEGFNVGCAHVPAAAVPAQTCRIVTAMIAAINWNERVIFFITRAASHFYAAFVKLAVHATLLALGCDGRLRELRRIL